MSLAKGVSIGVGSADAGDSPRSIETVVEQPARAPKVRKILRLEARARRALARYEQALATTARTMSQARALLDDAQILESSLTGAQLAELRRGRAEALGTMATPGSTPPDTPSTTTPSMKEAPHA